MNSVDPFDDPMPPPDDYFKVNGRNPLAGLPGKGDYFGLTLDPQHKDLLTKLEGTPGAPASETEGPPQIPLVGDTGVQSVEHGEPREDDPESLIKKALNYDPDKDPDYIKARESRDKHRAEEEKRVAKQAEMDDLIAKAPGPPEPPVLKKAAPELRDFAVKGMPWLMILTALGGKVGKLSGQNMIGAMTGMLKGAQAGQQKMFDEAYKRWQDNWARQQEDWKNKLAFYNAQMGWRKGQVDAEQRSIEAYHVMAGEDKEDMTLAVGKHGAMDKAMLALRAQNLRIEATRERIHEMQEKRVDAETKLWGDKTTNWARVVAANRDIDVAMEVLPKIIAAYKNTDEGRNTTVPPPLSKILTALKDDKNVGIFVGAMRAAEPLLTMIDTAQSGARSNMLLQAMIQNTITTDFWTAPMSQIVYSTQAAQGILRTAMNEQRDVLNVYKQRAESSRRDLGMADWQLPELEGVNIQPHNVPGMPAYRDSPSTEGPGGTEKKADTVVKYDDKGNRL
jgi:hypothetical protein